MAGSLDSCVGPASAGVRIQLPTIAVNAGVRYVFVCSERGVHCGPCHRWCYLVTIIISLMQITRSIKRFLPHLTITFVFSRGWGGGGVSPRARFCKKYHIRSCEMI